MKFIETFKSPNFDARVANYHLSHIIIHYTAMTTYQEALQFMCDKKNKVSSHFLISKKGDIFYLIDLDKRAWHAGESYWKGLEDINSCSIGIEIDYSGYHINNEEYSISQIRSLTKLINYLINKYKIAQENIIGHSDIAPFRKIDPGERFPWDKLAKQNLCYLPKISFDYSIDKHKKIKKSTKLKVFNDVIKIFTVIGYDTRGIIKSGKNYNLLVQAYQRHYRQSNVSGEMDIETLELLKKHYKDLLT